MCGYRSGCDARRRRRRKKLMTNGLCRRSTRARSRTSFLKGPDTGCARGKSTGRRWNFYFFVMRHDCVASSLIIYISQTIHNIMLYSRNENCFYDCQYITKKKKRRSSGRLYNILIDLYIHYKYKEFGRCVWLYCFGHDMDIWIVCVWFFFKQNLIFFKSNIFSAMFF